MPELPSIEVTAEELDRRVAAVPPGGSLQKVSEALGGPPYELPAPGSPMASWRFRLPDGAYDIYRAEFDGDRLVEGMVIPRGGA